MSFEIEKYNPCPEAVEFRSKFSSFKEAWDACPRGDWMLWLAYKLKVDDRLAAAYAAAVAYVAAADDVADVARKKNQLKTANICREILTEAVMKKIEQER